MKIKYLSWRRNGFVGTLRFIEGSCNRLINDNSLTVEEQKRLLHIKMEVKDIIGRSKLNWNKKIEELDGGERDIKKKSKE